MLVYQFSGCSPFCLWHHPSIHNHCCQEYLIGWRVWNWLSDQRFYLNKGKKNSWHFGFVSVMLLVFLLGSVTAACVSWGSSALVSADVIIKMLNCVTIRFLCMSLWSELTVSFLCFLTTLYVCSWSPTLASADTERKLLKQSLKSGSKMWVADQ